MEVLLVGLNHRTAPVDLREALVLSGCGLPMALDDLRSLPEPGIAEAALVSTCNRLEIYAVVREAEDGFRALEHFLTRLQDLPPETLLPHTYRLAGDAAVTHLMEVAAGIDSMVLGEPQILGQVAEAFEVARQAGTSGPLLAHLFSQAMHAGKRARAETGISRHTTSVSHAAARLITQEVPHGDSAHVLLVGAGEMAGLAAQALKDLGFANVAVVNRTFIAAQTLAAQHGGNAFAWHELSTAIAWADAIVSATGAPHLVLGRESVARGLEGRGARPLVVVDIAVPRDVEAAVGDLPGVRLFDIDNLQSVLDQNLKRRQAEVPAVRAIVAEEAERFREWRQGRAVAPVIRDLRGWAQELAAEEVEAAMRRLPDAGSHTREVVALLAHRLVNRLLHEPTTRLRLLSAGADAIPYAQAVRDLFDLDAVPGDSGRPSKEAALDADAELAP